MTQYPELPAQDADTIEPQLQSSQESAKKIVKKVVKRVKKIIKKDESIELDPADLERIKKVEMQILKAPVKPAVLQKPKTKEDSDPDMRDINAFLRGELKPKPQSPQYEDLQKNLEVSTIINREPAADAKPIELPAQINKPAEHVAEAKSEQNKTEQNAIDANKPEKSVQDIPVPVTQIQIEKPVLKPEEDETQKAVLEAIAKPEVELHVNDDKVPPETIQLTKQLEELAQPPAEPPAKPVAELQEAPKTIPAKAAPVVEQPEQPQVQKLPVKAEAVKPELSVSNLSKPKAAPKPLAKVVPLKAKPETKPKPPPNQALLEANKLILEKQQKQKKIEEEARKKEEQAAIDRQFEMAKIVEEPLKQKPKDVEPKIEPMQITTTSLQESLAQASLRMPVRQQQPVGERHEAIMNAVQQVLDEKENAKRQAIELQLQQELNEQPSVSLFKSESKAKPEGIRQQQAAIFYQKPVEEVVESKPELSTEQLLHQLDMAEKQLQTERERKAKESNFSLVNQQNQTEIQRLKESNQTLQQITKELSQQRDEARNASEALQRELRDERLKREEAENKAGHFCKQVETALAATGFKSIEVLVKENQINNRQISVLKQKVADYEDLRKPKPQVNAITNNIRRQLKQIMDIELVELKKVVLQKQSVMTSMINNLIKANKVKRISRADVDAAFKNYSMQQIDTGQLSLIGQKLQKFENQFTHIRQQLINQQQTAINLDFAAKQSDLKAIQLQNYVSHQRSTILAINSEVQDVQEQIQIQRRSIFENKIDTSAITNCVQKLSTDSVKNRQAAQKASELVQRVHAGLIQKLGVGVETSLAECLKKVGK